MQIQLKGWLNKDESIEIYWLICRYRRNPFGIWQSFRKRYRNSIRQRMGWIRSKTYKANFSDDFEIAGDITKINESDIPKFDICLAGFPCQPFSVCGNQKGFSDKRGNLFFEIIRIADSLQCPVIFLENVANLTEHENGKTFNVIHNELASRDYFIRYIIADACITVLRNIAQEHIS